MSLAVKLLASIIEVPTASGSFLLTHTPGGSSNGSRSWVSASVGETWSFHCSFTHTPLTLL